MEETLSSEKLLSMLLKARYRISLLQQTSRDLPG